MPASETALTSTLGAGDVYHGALLAGLLEDRSPEEAMERANVDGSHRAAVGRRASRARGSSWMKWHALGGTLPADRTGASRL